MKNVWEKLRNKKGGFFCLAPMSGITDITFRQIISKIGRPDIFWTEFVSCDGICSAGKKELLSNLIFDEKKERPIIAQFFGKNPKNFYQCGKLSKELKFDGVDINLGCPDRAVIRQGAGASLIKDKPLVKEIISATKKGAKDLPVSVKTRIGWDKNEVDDWIPFLLENDLTAITIHGRTKKQVYSGVADWEAIGEAVEIRNRMDKKTIIIGNGDIKSAQEGIDKMRIFGVDGIMIGRGVLANPWVFSGRDGDDISREERINALSNHLKLFSKIYKGKKPFNEMKKYFKPYISGFLGAKELRIKLMDSNSVNDVIHILLLKK